MEAKDISDEENMKVLRQVLSGDDKTVMWAALDRMKLSPKDTPYYAADLGNAGYGPRMGYIGLCSYQSPLLYLDGYDSDG